MHSQERLCYWTAADRAPVAEIDALEVSTPPLCEARGRHRFVDESVPSRGGDAFGDKYAALRRAMPDRLDRLIGWRILPALRFLHAVEGDHHKAFWRVTLERQGLAPTNEIMAIERRQRSRNLLPIFLKGGWVLHIDFRKYVAECRLELACMNHGGAGNAYRNANQHCKRQFVVRFHEFIPPLCLCEQALAS